MKAKNLILNGIIVVLLIIVVANFYTIMRNKDDSTLVSMPLGVASLTVTSGSMEPYFKPGDRILIRKTDADDLMKGDIITFSQNKRIITHRIADIQNDSNELTFTTKGDHNNTEDPTKVKAEDIIGVFVLRFSLLNIFTRGFVNGYGNFFIIAIIVVAVLLVADIYKGNKKN